MAGRNPFQSRILGEQLFIEHNFLVLTPQLSKSAFKPLTNRLESARNFANSIYVAILCYRSGIDACNWCSRSKEIFNYLWYETAFTGFRRLPDNRTEVQLPFRQTL